MVISRSLFFQAVGGYGECLNQRGFTVVDVPGGAYYAHRVLQF
jgi:hypothetical protein